MKKNIIICALFALLVVPTFYACGNTASQKDGKHDIEIPLGQKGDFYADNFNVHLNKAIMSEVALSGYLPLYVGEEYQIARDSTNSNELYMYDGYSVVDSLELDTAIAWLQKGIEECPQRLDLRLGLSSTYRTLDNGAMMLSTMEQTIDWLMSNKKKKVTWTSDITVDPEEMAVESAIHDYFVNCEYSSSHKHLAIKFVDLGIRYNPNYAIFYNDKAVILLDNGDNDGALKLMKKALELAPDDELIRSNIEYLENER